MPARARGRASMSSGSRWHLRPSVSLHVSAAGLLGWDLECGQSHQAGRGHGGARGHEPCLTPGGSTVWAGLGGFGTELLSHADGPRLCVLPFPTSHPNEWAVLLRDASSLPCFQEKGACFGSVDGREGRGDLPEPDGAAGWGWKLSLSSGAVLTTKFS